MNALKRNWSWDLVCPARSSRWQKNPTCFYKVCRRIYSLLNILNSSHYYTQTQKLFRGKITGITWHPSWLLHTSDAGFEMFCRRLDFWFIWFYFCVQYWPGRIWRHEKLTVFTYTNALVSKFATGLTDQLPDKSKHKVCWDFLSMDQRSEVAGLNSLLPEYSCIA